MKATTEMIEYQMEALRMLTGNKELKCIFDRQEGGWRIDDHSENIDVGTGHDTNSFYHILYGLCKGIKEEKDKRNIPHAEEDQNAHIK